MVLLNATAAIIAHINVQWMSDMNSIVKFFKYKLFYKRTWTFLYQRLTRGWDNSELWSLDYSLAKLILPRLKEFVKYSHGCPQDQEEKDWQHILNEMVYAMQFMASKERWACDDKKIWERVNAGLELFGKHFGSLWL